MNEDRLLRPQEVAREYGIPRDAIYADLHNGRLKSIVRGSRFYVPRWAVGEWIREEVQRDPQ